MEYNSARNRANHLKLRARAPLNCTTHKVLLPFVSITKCETLELKIYYKGAYASYQYIISLLSLDQLISSMFVFNLLT